MKHERRIPAWLLRDLPALGGLFACFWLFVIPLITEGFRLIRGGKPCQRKADALAHPLLAAEATLAYALWREAYRRLGYNPRDVKLELADLPANNLAVMARIRSYMDQVQNLSRAAAHYTDVLRQRWGASVRVAHASTDALRAAQHELVGVAASSSRTSQVALMLSSAPGLDPGARPSKHERVLAHARGPPTFPNFPLSTTDRLSAPARLRTHRHVHASSSSPPQPLPHHPAPPSVSAARSRTARGRAPAPSLAARH